MTYKLELIEHSNAAKLAHYLRLFHYLSVYEPDGTLQSVIYNELFNYDRKGRFLTKFNLVIALNDQGSIVGYTFYYPKGHLVEFYVLPNWRSKGVGSKLVDGIRTWSNYSTLCGYPGIGHWKEFFEKNFILNVDRYESISRDDALKYGDPHKAYKAVIKAAKIKLSRKLRLVLDI